MPDLQTPPSPRATFPTISELKDLAAGIPVGNLFRPQQELLAAAYLDLLGAVALWHQTSAAHSVARTLADEAIRKAESKLLITPVKAQLEREARAAMRTAEETERTLMLAYVALQASAEALSTRHAGQPPFPPAGA